MSVKPNPESALRDRSYGSRQTLTNGTMNSATARKLRFLAAFAAYFATLWLLWNTPVVYPLKLFVVLLHELGHGLATIMTGGVVRAIAITPDQGGVCLCAGGNRLVSLSAGYLGSLALGALILEGALTRAERPRVITALLGAGTIIITALAVRNVFGMLFGAGFGFGLVIVARYLPLKASTVLLTALGLTSCLYAILDIKSDVLDRPWARSDAAMLAEITGVPTIAWGLFWIILALAASWLLLRRAMRRAS